MFHMFGFVFSNVFVFLCFSVFSQLQLWFFGLFSRDCTIWQEQQAAATVKSCVLSDALNEQGLESCILFPGSGVIEVERSDRWKLDNGCVLLTFSLDSSMPVRDIAC